ncbi:hypothetical protein V2J09_012538 [Rumex salicifolius]
MKIFLFTLFLLRLFLLPPIDSADHDDGFLHLRSLSPHRSNLSAQQQLQISQPLPFDHLTPSCSVLLLSHSFANTVAQPPHSVDYSSPEDCSTPSSWSHLVLQLNATCQGEQYDRIAAVWLDGAEILRTSTPEPVPGGIFWNVRKDVTRYSSLFARSNVALSMMLENVVNDVFTGVFNVNLTLLVYTVKEVRDPSLGGLIEELGFGSEISEGNDTNWPDWDQKPADLIVPVSEEEDLGFWYRIRNESDVGSRSIEIPKNARKIVLEYYVSAHGDDEFWYSNPPNAYIESNNLTNKRGNGAFREVFVRIDGNLIASEIPFPVVFTGGINPLFWEPIVGIGAFDLPSYDFDLTPFLGLLLDGKNHTFELGVNKAIQFWLVDANLHIWLDKGLDSVQAGLAVHYPPKFNESWNSDLNKMDGSFEVEAERTSRSSGWVAFSCANLTTQVMRKFKFKNSIKFEANGTHKVVSQKVKLKIQVTLRSSEADGGGVISKRTLKRYYPLIMRSKIAPGSEPGTYVMTTKVSHALNGKSSVGKVSWTTHNRQKSGGWMLVKDHSVLSGSANTQQRISYRNETACYARQVKAANGELLSDVSSSVCLRQLHDVLEKIMFLGW